MNPDKRNLLAQSLYKGVLVGGSLGVLAGIFVIDPPRAFFLGVGCGLLAGWTFYKRESGKR